MLSFGSQVPSFWCRGVAESAYIHDSQLPDPDFLLASSYYFAFSIQLSTLRDLAKLCRPDLGEMVREKDHQ
jgi:hypothetical protein